MIYALLRYGIEDVAAQGEDRKSAISRPDGVTGVDIDRNEIRLIADLLPTTTAVTVRGIGNFHVIDGPFASMKEELLGFHIIEVPSLEDAIATAQKVSEGRLGSTACEIRPVVYLRGAL